MADSSWPAQRAALDSDRFEVEVYRADLARDADVDGLLKAPLIPRPCLVIARVPTDRPRWVQALERDGYFLCDTLIYYRGLTARISSEAHASSSRTQLGAASTIRRGRPQDAERLAPVIRTAFTAFSGHYHQDARLDAARATEGYVQWGLSSLSDPASFVLVAEIDDRMAGFITVQRLETDDGSGATEARIQLNGVDPAHQGRGVYAALFRKAIDIMRSEAVAQVVVSTQLHNLGPQKVWVRHGLEPSQTQHTLHRWYDEESHEGSI